MNTFNIVGKIYDTPDEIQESNNLKYRRIRVATQRITQDELKTEVYEISLFNKLTENELKLGDNVEITGRITANNYEKDDRIRYSCSLSANTVVVIS